MIHFIKSTTVDGVRYVLWQAGHYVYQIDRGNKTMITMNASVEEASAVFDHYCLYLTVNTVSTDTVL